MGTKTSLIILCLCCWVVSSCQKEDFDLQHPDTDQFVAILKEGNYFTQVGYELPDFTEDHIGRLLVYLNDTTHLQQFPTNPFSSKYTQPKILNECLFWTIDGIRSRNKYPSMEPCLIDTTTYSNLTGYTRLSGRKLVEISKIYIDWYEEYQKNRSETVRKKNLFKNTPYLWN